MANDYFGGHQYADIAPSYPKEVVVTDKEVTALEALKQDHQRGINYLVNTVLSLRQRLGSAGVLRDIPPAGETAKNGGIATPSPVRTPLEYWIADQTAEVRNVERMVEEILDRSI